MIILDTNVVSEPLRPAPDPRVVAWLDRQAIETLYLTSVTVAELLTGIEVLPASKRKRRLRADIDAILTEHFDNRILPFDLEAARAFAELRALARRQGASISMADGQIASIARTRGFAVATRDVAFSAAGIETIDPWRA